MKIMVNELLNYIRKCDLVIERRTIIGPTTPPHE